MFPSHCHHLAPGIIHNPSLTFRHVGKTKENLQGRKDVNQRSYGVWAATCVAVTFWCLNEFPDGDPMGIYAGTITVDSCRNQLIKSGLGWFLGMVGVGMGRGGGDLHGHNYEGKVSEGVHWSGSPVYCIALYCTALCCVVLYCIALCHVVLNCIVLYCIILYCIVLCCILFCTALHCTVLYCTVLYCVVLYCIVISRSFVTEL